MTLRIAVLIALILGSACVRAQESVEKTDSTITQIVYPEKELKIWYGSDDFRVDRFVILPNYTLLYNNALSTFRLLENSENLVKDEAHLLRIKSVRPYHVVVGSNEQKWALGPTTTWFTVLTDSTVLAGTVLFEGRKEVPGYLLITIKNGKLLIEEKQFDLDSKTDNVEPNYLQLIDAYTDYKGAQLYSSRLILSPTPKDEFVAQKSLYLKTAQKPLFLYFAEKLDTTRRKLIYPYQLIATNDRLLIYNPEAEQLRVVTTDIANPVLLDVAKALPNNVPRGRKFGPEFMVDRVTNQLYYKTLANSEGIIDQLVMSVRLTADTITFDPVLRSGMTNYFSRYVNNRKLFFYDSKKGYIYVTKADLP
ncbi:hypothetical protein [uncultured Fibrella sp.]|uniref:hypothetical protein n=1 Tax=uncultured Fibrella sp. TaxID=1284596 RepID=UPI0035CBF6AD